MTMCDLAFQYPVELQKVKFLSNIQCLHELVNNYLFSIITFINEVKKTEFGGSYDPQIVMAKYREYEKL